MEPREILLQITRAMAHLNANYHKPELIVLGDRAYWILAEWYGHRRKFFPRLDPADHLQDLPDDSQALKIEERKVVETLFNLPVILDPTRDPDSVTVLPGKADCLLYGDTVKAANS